MSLTRADGTPREKKAFRSQNREVKFRSPERVRGGEFSKGGRSPSTPFGSQDLTSRPTVATVRVRQATSSGRVRGEREGEREGGKDRRRERRR